MDYIVGGNEEANLLVGRQHQPVIDIEQVELVFRLKILDLFHWCRIVAVIADAGIEILVVPFPLRRCDQHGNVRVVVILNLAKSLGCGNRHANKDQYRDRGPDDFDQSAVTECGGNRISRATVCKHRVEHGAKHDDADDDAYPQAHMMQLLQALAHLGDAGAHVEFRRKGSMGNAPYDQDRQAALQPAGEGSQAPLRTLLEGFRNAAPRSFSYGPVSPCTWMSISSLPKRLQCLVFRQRLNSSVPRTLHVLLRCVL